MDTPEMRTNILFGLLSVGVALGVLVATKSEVVATTVGMTLLIQAFSYQGRPASVRARLLWAVVLTAGVVLSFALAQKLGWIVVHR